MNTSGSRFLMCLPIVAAIGCGSDPGATPDCTGPFESSCDLPNDNGLHTCYDVVVADAAGVRETKTTCAGPPSGGTVLPACCKRDGAIARCVFMPTHGGVSTEWFFSGSVATAQASCDSKSGTFTAL
jgi:hypothetical protein